MSETGRSMSKEDKELILSYFGEMKKQMEKIDRSCQKIINSCCKMLGEEYEYPGVPCCSDKNIKLS